MNANRMHAYALRHIMEIKGACEGNPNHQEHIRDYCEYADTVARGEADEVRQEIPKTVQQEVHKEMNSRKV